MHTQNVLAEAREAVRQAQVKAQKAAAKANAAKSRLSKVGVV
jgi:hypothetical protein